LLNWLFSRPLQVKFLVSTILLVSIGLLVLVLSVFQILSQQLALYSGREIQQRTHILAMAMMVGPAAHNESDMRKLLQDVAAMHGYCYLSVQDSQGGSLASIGEIGAQRGANCTEGSIPLLHDGKVFGVLNYAADTSFINALERSLRSKLVIMAMLWLFAGTFVYFLLVRRLVQPLRAITLASESMAHGNLNTPMPQGLPQDELGKLAVSFSNMATALRERIEYQQHYAHALYAEQARLNALVSILPVGIYFVDPARHVQYINIECRQLWGLSESEDYTGWSDTDLIAHARDQLEQPVAFMQNVDAALRVHGISPPFDTALRNGRIIRSRSCAVPDATGDLYIGRIWMFEDVTTEQARLHQAEARADRDGLTGLYNRRRFEEDIKREFAQVRRNDSRLSLLYFDLDGFKNINDRYGHAAGDRVLKTVAQTLTLQARRNEYLFRLGGDEFGILVADATVPQIEAMAQRVVSAIENLPFDFADPPMHVSCSMGIAACSAEDHPDDIMELLHQADTAMYQAKRSSTKRWLFFDSAPRG
jgi:diguanylate cyclase (GGDEF)-like protein